MADKQGRQERRSQLLAAGLELFAAHGFEGTSTSAIANAAGVTESLIFHYFPSKASLFHEVVSTYGFQSFHSPLPASLDGRSLTDVLGEGLNGFLDTLWKNRVAIKLIIGAEFRDSVAANDAKGFDSRPRERLKRLLIRYEEAGEVRIGIASIASAVISSAVVGFFSYSMRNEPLEWESARSEFVNGLIGLVMPGLRPVECGAGQ